MEDDEGNLKDLGIKYFSHIFKDDNQSNILAQLNVIKLFPSMLTKEGADYLIEEVTIGEIEGALKTFKKDKTPGPDEWPVEFFLEFFDLIGGDLLNAVECSRLTGRVTPSLKYTFLSLIPEKNKPITFANYRPISLCNLVYKLITKIIALRLKPHLDKSISHE